MLFGRIDISAVKTEVRASETARRRFGHEITNYGMIASLGGCLKEHVREGRS
jgi:hypothetical protein